MKVSVRIRGEWLAVPCRDGRQTVQWLGEEALRRYMKLQPSSYLDGRSEKIFEIRKTRGGAILDGEDVIKNVLDDNEFVSVGTHVGQRTRSQNESAFARTRCGNCASAETDIT